MATSSYEDFSVNSIIGPGTSVRGDIEVAGFIRVDGALRGDLTTKGRVVIGERARMESDIIGSTVVVGGVVKGNIFASERVSVLSTGLVLGDIITKRIQADPGNLIHGRIVACGNTDEWIKKLSAYRDEKGILRSALAKFQTEPDRGDV